MKKDMYGFTVVVDGNEFTSDEFRALCKYEGVTLSIYSSGTLDEFVSSWNIMMPISKKATLYFDGELSGGFKRSSEPRRGKRSVNCSKTGALYVNK